VSLVNIKVDDRELEAPEGALLIEVLLENEIKIPHFCYHEALGADGNCRMCMVGIEGQKRPQIACDTFVIEGMEVSTKSPTIRAVQQEILELELINHPIDCPTCDQAGECKLQDYYMEYGLYDSHIEASDKVKHHKHIDLGSNVMLDQERCVLCARCTRFTTDITKTNELGIIGRGDEARVSTMPNKKLDNPYAMNIVDLCPVGALTSKDFRFKQRSWFLSTSSSICHGCATGCNIYIDHNCEKYKDATIYRFRPRINKEVNGHFICDEGRLSYKDLQTNRQRERVSNGKIVTEVEAIEAYKKIVDESQNITLLVDANCYNEELEAIVGYAQSIGASLYSPLECYEDASFADDWLRSSQRVANATGVKNLAIETSIPTDYSTDLLINFNHPTPELIKYKTKIEFQSHQSREADLILPLAVFSESAGSVTNRDGLIQYCQKAICSNNPIPTVMEWISLLDDPKIS